MLELYKLVVKEDETLRMEQMWRLSLLNRLAIHKCMVISLSMVNKLEVLPIETHTNTQRNSEYDYR